jgi:predicted RNase H-like nuclease (RuvC/YqgF family)
MTPDDTSKAGKAGEDEQEAEAQAAQADEVQEDEFDKERALSTIRKQRAAEKELRAKAKALEDRLAKFEAQERQAQERDLSELDKTRKALEALTAKHSEAVETAQALRLQMDFGRTAAKLGIKWASAQAQDDALELADMEGVEIGADGKVVGLDVVIKQLQKDRPYLFSSIEQAGEKRPSGTPAGQRKPAAATQNGNQEPAAPLTSL